MTLVSWVCFSASFLIIFSCFKKGADFFSPARVFGFVWTFAIGLADLKLSGFQHEWTWYGWIILLLGILSFLLGIFAVSTHYLSAQILSISEIRERIQKEAQEEINDNRLFWTVITLFVAYLVAYVVEVFIEGNVPLFSPRIERLRIEFGVFGLHLVVNAMLSIMLLVVEYLLLFRVNRLRRRVLGTVFFIVVVTFFLLLQRYNFFVLAVMALGLTYYGSRYLRFRTVLIVGLFFLGFLVLIQSFRLSQYVQQYLYVTSRMKFSQTYAIFTEPYMYIVMNLENFARGVEKLDVFWFGYFSADWLLALTGLKHWLREYFGIIPLPYLVSGYNTFTFHWWYYYDFGIPGVAILPLLEGAAIASAYYKLRTQPGILILFFYSAGLLLMVISFIMNPLNRLDFVSNIILIWFLHLFFFRKRKNMDRIHPGHIH